MDLGNIIMWVIVGGIGGWLASFFVKVPMGGILGNIIAGVIGGLLVGWLGSFINILPAVSGFNCASIIAAFIGALVVSAIAGFALKGKKQ
ncbi:GlsB/YeaQ/YmgE family stress response membrane protein [Anaerolineae bacterium CFX7]|nr:GlsB/YeaQ/YmgE family stress response membrane protein [Anaerolineae bacterium CFX7]